MISYPLLLRVLLGSLAAIAPLAVGSCSSSSNADDEGRYPLWKIEGKSNTVWLLGSVHMLPESAHPFPEAFDRAYEEAENVIFEIDMSEMDLMQIVSVFSQALLPGGETLDDVLEPETMEMLEPRLGELLGGISSQLEGFAESMPEGVAGMPMELDEQTVRQMMLRMQPWFIGFLIQSAEVPKEEYRADLGVDLFYMSRAMKDDREIGGLETFEDQISVFRSLAGDDPDSYIRALLQQSDTVASEIDAIVEAWKRGDLSELERHVTGELKKDPEVYRLLLTDRNENWIPHIERFLRSSGDYLVVVGAGHLVGDRSVVDLLRQRGYRVVRQ